MLAEADVVAEEMIYYHRTHPCPLETCGCVASMDKVNGKLTLWGTFQAPHAVRTVASLISGIAEHNIRVVSPDIGGGFGNKVGVYPGYVCSIVASIVTGVPVKWIEDRMENLMSTAFARDYWMNGRIAATKDGQITGLWCHVTADHGGFDACADPTKFPAGFFNICTGSYDIPVAYLAVDGVYTNKAPGGVAYRCSFRVTEASLLHRAHDRGARVELGHGRGRAADEATSSARTSSPTTPRSAGNTTAATTTRRWDKALKAVDYDGLRARAGRAGRGLQARRDAQAHGRSACRFFTEIVGAGPVKNCDILGLGMFDSLRDPHPSDRLGHRPARHHQPGPGPRHDLRPDPRLARSASRPTTSPSRRATPTPRPTASAPTARARRRSPAPPRRWRGARSAPRRR